MTVTSLHYTIVSNDRQPKFSRLLKDRLMHNDDNVVDVQAKEVRPPTTVKRTSSTLWWICVCWLAGVSYLGHQNYPSTWYLVTLTAGWPAMLALFIRFLITGRLGP
jgi:hypothetical protein